MELGARWGTWGCRGVAFLRRVNPMPYRLILVEPKKVHCSGAHMVLKLNSLEGELKCTHADAALFLKLMEDVPHLDLLHIDIQGAEGPLLADPQVRQVLESKVYRIILGTHWEDMYRFAVDIFQAWITVFSLPQGFYDCMEAVGIIPLALAISRVPLQLPEAHAWAQLRSRSCFHTTPLGRVANIDGSFILDNPRFVNASRAFYLNDMTLRMDDLIK
ncbi:unnamed protein product [Symbiodinium natans]|uniref:Methyltransferase FkbM domain-containing protein n=1 Tax=Symbiodinium natans TaxID=878477 RepID=A0A812MWF6_9DINO|nr:unnamed protein product [Symbiodinium natans]